jgi:pimeloyl-ACP methyl ester carboxylesterase
MEQGIIEVRPDLQIFYRDVGEGEPPVVVPLACWTEDFDQLANKRRLLYYDPRGRGLSSAIAVDEASFDADLSDLAAVHANSGSEQIALIGWSYFGGLVARYAMLYPERVSRVITIGGLPIRRDPWMDMIEREAGERMAVVDPDLVRRMRESDGPEQFHAFWTVFEATRMGRPPVRPAPKRLADISNEWPENFFPRGQRIMQSLGDWDWREDARRLTMPLLVIGGSADVAPEAAPEWAEYAPNARVLMMDRVGHFPAFENPQLFFRIVDQFLRGEWPAEAEPFPRRKASANRAMTT